MQNYLSDLGFWVTLIMGSTFFACVLLFGAGWPQGSSRTGFIRFQFVTLAGLARIDAAERPGSPDHQSAVLQVREHHPHDLGPAAPGRARHRIPVFSASHAGAPAPSGLKGPPATRGDASMVDLAHILFDQALLAEGGLPADPAASM